MFGPVRPKLYWRSEQGSEELRATLRAALKAPGAPVKGLVAPTRIELHPPVKAQHMWSPQLAVDLRPHAVDQCTLIGRFSPHPNVWTLYVAMSAALGFAALLFGAYGYVQWTMGQDPWALLGLPGGLLGVLALYLLSQLGQSLGHDQMDELVEFLQAHAPGLVTISENEALQPCAADQQT